VEREIEEPPFAAEPFFELPDGAIEHGMACSAARGGTGPSLVGQHDAHERALVRREADASDRGTQIPRP